MLGSFRFILAWIVMLSHLPFSPFPYNFNPAVSAVVMFYFISGYLMFFSFKKETLKRNAIIKSALFFYLKRILRIFPLYLIVLFLTVTVIYFFGPSQLIPLLNQHLSFDKLLLNAVLILNNYVFYPFEIKALLPHPLIPPTWSLSTEWHFYLLVPFIFVVLYKRIKYLYALFIFSLFIQLLAFSINTPYFNSDNFGYRYIFGVLWIFLFGFLYSCGKRTFFKLVYLFLIVYFMFIGFYFTSYVFVKEILLAILFLPFIPKLLEFEFKYDKFFGSLSYPIFISHFLVFLIVEKLGIRNKFFYFFTVFLILLLFSVLLSKIQEKIDLIRKKL